jgi:uncharacterized protein YodC (DUF2158 family)
MNPFEIGEVVQLKSGGPLMTVHSIGDYSPTGPNPGLLCVWFDDKKKVDDVFDPRAVDRYQD